MEVKELCKANGGAWGGTKVDEAFKCFINDIADKDSKTIIPLPQSLCTLIEKRQGRALCDLIKNTYYASSFLADVREG
ncbi:hypothetical protein MAR_006873 [Mya arenaria]|uniref:Uncharacterized protein n=1 Tax=Mya arenaria TaxID=6604 RepID=A0ABY7D9S8_MYAAR|nr:hypothetical protein MAR_006873 [Mya arenaria]